MRNALLCLGFTRRDALGNPDVNEIGGELREHLAEHAQEYDLIIFSSEEPLDVHRSELRMIPEVEESLLGLSMHVNRPISVVRAYRSFFEEEPNGLRGLLTEGPFFVSVRDIIASEPTKLSIIGNKVEHEMATLAQANDLLGPGNVYLLTLDEDTEPPDTKD